MEAIRDSAGGIGNGEWAFLHWCEVCGRQEALTADAAYRDGWDFPPRMGAWGVISPRTCPTCTIEKTLWWALTMKKVEPSDLTDHQRQVLGRILNEAPPAPQQQN